MRKTILTIVAIVALLGIASPAHSAESRVQVPSGFKVTERAALGEGLIHYRLVRTRPAAVVNVAWQAFDAPSELRVVLSNDAIAEYGPLSEPTSGMCARIACLVAVNGDFFAGEGTPVGAVLSDGRLMRSPSPKHHQLSRAADGTFSTGLLSWRGTLVPSDLQPLELDGVNMGRDADDLILYTPSHGPSTQTNPYGVELVLSVARPEGDIRVGQTTVVRFEELRQGGDTPIPGDGAVLSGHGRAATALLDLWRRLSEGDAGGEALLRLDVDPKATDSIGGSPILVRDGKRWFADQDRSLYQSRHPRTVAGWNRSGDLLLVTVDGRQAGHSVGMTMVEAADLMIGLGAVEAINLDGGGSTTFVVEGSVVNRPSDRAVRRSGETTVVSVPRYSDRVIANVERPVAVALALVGPTPPFPATPALGAGNLAIPLTPDDGRGFGELVFSPDAGRQHTTPIVLTLMSLSAGAVAFRRRAAAA